MIKQAGTAVALAAVIALGATGATSADTYTVRGCAAGWEAHADQGAAATDACATGGGLTAQLVGPGPWAGGTFAFHRFTAPAGTRIARVTGRPRHPGDAGRLGPLVLLHLERRR